MKAAWYEQQGHAEKVLQVGEMPLTAISENDVLVRVAVSGINPSDVKRRQGARESMLYPRVVPHSDGSGIIEKIGKNVPEHRLGQRVWIYNAQWRRPYGTAAEYVVLPSDLAVPLPDNASFETGACLGISALTAHRCVFANGPIKNKTILITGGAGNVGQYAIKFAKWGGAKIISTVSHSEKVAISEEAGADYVLNYKEENIIEKIKLIAGNEGVDHIVEVDFGGNLAVNTEIIKTNGCIATYASMGNAMPQIPFYDLLIKNMTLHLVYVYELTKEAREKAIHDINYLLEQNKLTQHVAARFSLDNIVAAHQLVESGKYIGHVLLLF